MLNYDDIKQAILTEIRTTQYSLQSRTVIDEVARKLGLHGNGDHSQPILTVFGELFRTGYLSWGYNASNPDPPFFHITEIGKRALEYQSRDPSNEQGYLTHLGTIGTLSPIAISYLKEALRTFNSDCPKASAVMIGCAAETLALELRDVMVSRLASSGRQTPAALVDWRIKTVLDEIQRQLEAARAQMDRGLRETFSAHWSSFVHQIRMVRNDAGHPTSIDPVTTANVHASLLIFPELFQLQRDLVNWVNINYP
jgi:hypothetical protein